jgi:hypothetical protein
MKNCENCGNQFQEQRTTAKFCSPKCKLDFNRKKDSPKTEETVKPAESERWIPNWERAGIKDKETALNNILKIASDIQNHRFFFRGYWFNTEKI